MSYKYEWLDSCGQSYLSIEGDSRRELGLAYGHGAAKLIRTALEATRRKAAKWAENPQREAQVQQLIEEYYARIPEEYLEEIDGIREGYLAETGDDVSLRELAKQSFEIDLNNRMQIRDRRGCTNFGIVNSDGSVTHGQNYDASPSLLERGCFCLQKLKGHPAMFILRSGASLGMAVGKNEYGVCMTVSIVKTSLEAESMTCRAVLVREALEQRTALDAIRTMAPGGKSPFCFNLVVSDNSTVVASQAIPGEQRITCVKDFVVQSNQYDYVDWQKYLLKPAYSKKRQFYAEQQIREWRGRYGYVTDTDLIEILRDEPVLCRTKIGDGIGTTVLFFTRESFGMGNALKNPIGRQPL